MNAEPEQIKPIIVPELTKVTLVVPVLNESAAMSELLRRIDLSLRDNFDYQVVVIDDNSTDNTVEVVNLLSHKYPVTIELKSGLQGKAYSLIQGFKKGIKTDFWVMIDADLQYPPEIIPQLISQLQDGANISIGARIVHNESLLRKIASKVFKTAFIQFLHGLKVDSQSGLKAFKPEMIKYLPVKPEPWTFDLEFLLKARAAGALIESTPIMFEERTTGESKIKFINATWQIGFNALVLKYTLSDFGKKITKWLNPLNKIEIFSTTESNSRGIGFRHGSQEFIHHTELKHHETTYWSVYPRQKLWMVGIIILLILGFVFAPHNMLVVLIASLTFLYFADLLFNFFLIWRSYSSSTEVKITKREITKGDLEIWPTYTVFCPLYKEWSVVPQFLAAMDKMDYPKDRLQVMLLLEEDDKETIAKITEQELPSYVDIVVVPDSKPKTKPKAMNYGLAHATGEYLVIYDAEDIPEIDQLKKAVLAFKKLDPSVVCVQAKLNFYNPRQNILTRLFTAEYSLWFDLVLTGLQSLNGPIPLGGTSNHFRTKHLRVLRGWDAFNVTEDCDLGLRLFKQGYRTAMIDSTTYEEANSDVLNWYRQRSRWIKGYIQTYFVHMRKPKAMHVSWREPHFLTFQLVVGGKILSMFINPLMWLITLCYFLFRAHIGTTIETFFPTPVLYMGVFCFVFGNFLYLYYYMMGLAKRQLYDLIKYTALVPIYWLGISFAAWKAVYEIIRKPHYWQKTVHGLHLKKDQEKAMAEPAQPVKISKPAAELKPAFSFSLNKQFKSWKNHPAAGGALLVGAALIANFINFVFSAFLGRALTLEDFSTVTLFNTVFGMLGIIFAALGSSVNFRSAFLYGKKDNFQARVFTNKTSKQWLFISLAFTVVWIVSVPVLSSFFDISNWWLLAAFSPVLTAGALSAVYSGQLRGQFLFHLLARATVFESLSKLVVAVVLVYLGYKDLAALSLPISAVVSFLLTWRYAHKSSLKNAPFGVENKSQYIGFPHRYFGAAILSGLSTALFLNVDVLLAKHYLSPDDAGSYALLSLAGKMVFFSGSLLFPFITSIVAKHQGTGTNSRYDFHKLFNGTLAFTAIAFVGVGLMGKYTIPILFGDKALAVVPYLFAYSAAMALFTITGSVVSYHIAKREYSFAWISVASALAMLVGILFQHKTVSDFTFVIFSASLLYSIVVFTSHAVIKNTRFVLRTITDLFDLFLPSKKLDSIGKGKKRILVFNWRDTKHAYAGGAEIYIHELAKRWVTSGNQVTLFCGNDGQSERNDVVDGVSIVRRGGFYFVYIWAMLYYLVQFRGRFDVIIDCQNGVPFFTPLYAKEKVYCLMHHVHQEVFRKYLIKPLAIFAAFLERTVMPWAYAKTQFITISDSSHREMTDMGLGLAGMEIVHPGVDLVNLVPGQKDKVPLVLYLGRLKAYKSVDVLLRAFKLVKEQVPNAKLVIAGSGEAGKSLQKLSMELEFKIGDVLFAGKISEAEKVSWLQRAWVFVNPSMMEGWGITSIEANACGVPVVASNVPGLRDSVHNPHTGYLVEHGDVDVFAARILRILQNKPIRDFMAKNSITWANNFDWDKSATQSLSLISKEII